MKVKIIIICLLFWSCQKKQESRSMDIRVVKELKIKPEDKTVPNPAFVHLIDSDSGRYLFLSNYFSKTLQFLNLENGMPIKEIKLQYDGPNSIRNYTGIAGLEKDKVWLTFSPYAIGYLNYDGEIQFKTKIPAGAVDITYVSSDIHQELHQYQDKVFGMLPKFMNHHYMEKSAIQKHSLVYSYDMRSDQTRWYDVYYAQDYWENGKKPSNFSWARREDKLYIAPWYDHEIQVFDMKIEQLDNRVVARSNHISDFSYLNEIPGTHEEGLNNKLSHDNYGILLYDKYRDCFYRFFYPGFRDNKDYAIEQLWSLNRDRPFTGVMILDKDLNVIGEHVFDKFQVHATSNIFVAEDGLYLSLNNENHPDYDEDHLKYMVVRFDKKK